MTIQSQLLTLLHTIVSVLAFPCLCTEGTRINRLRRQGRGWDFFVSKIVKQYCTLNSNEMKYLGFFHTYKLVSQIETPGTSLGLTWIEN